MYMQIPQLNGFYTEGTKRHQFQIWETSNFESDRAALSGVYNAHDTVLPFSKLSIEANQFSILHFLFLSFFL